MFWSGDKIKQNLNSLIELEGDQQADENQIQCAAVCLRVGPEIYITNQDAKDNKGNTRITLKPNEQFMIPPGQFAFILTEEFVRVPKDAIGFISCKARLKFKGLVNVSGFHVDPGYYGRIIFGLYNTGPGDIALSRGSDAFLLWFAELESQAAAKYVRSGEKENSSISDELVTGISGEIFSPINVKKRIDDLKDSLADIKAYVQKQLFIFLGVILLVIFRGPILNLISNNEQPNAINNERLTSDLKKENPMLRGIDEKLNSLEKKINLLNTKMLENQITLEDGKNSEDSSHGEK